MPFAKALYFKGIQKLHWKNLYVFDTALFRLDSLYSLALGSSYKNYV